MTAKQVETLYVRACRKRRLRPGQAEGQEWLTRLKALEAADVQRAMAEWDADLTLDLRHKPKGRWLPSAAELAVLAGAIACRRQRAGKDGGRIVRWRCTGPLAHTWISSAGSGGVSGVVCGWCGAAAVEEALDGE